jgi:DNA polymerase IV
VETGYTFGKSGPDRFHGKLTFKAAGKIEDPTE